MRANRFLMQYEKASVLIENKRQRIEQLGDRAVKVTVQDFGERVQSSGSKDNMANSVASYVDLEIELADDIKKLEHLKLEIEKTIEQLPTAEYLVLYKFFIELKPLYEIMDEMDKSYSWVSKKKRKALTHVQKILNERYREDETEV